MYSGAKSTTAVSYPTPIAERVKHILGEFGTVLTTYTADDENRSAVQDNLSRFRIWAGNIGAYHVDERSVDFRVKDAPEVGQRILELLDDLSEGNEDIRAITSGERQDAAEEEYSGGEIGSDTEPSSELHELCLSVSDTITSLLKASALLRRATGRDRYAKAAAVKDDTFLEQFDIQHVAAMFPKVELQPWLRDRLGKANIQRRQYLRYARKHHDKMTHEPTFTADVTADQSKLSEEDAPKIPISQTKTLVSSRPTSSSSTASTFDLDLMSGSTTQNTEVDHLDDSFTPATSVVTSGEKREGAISGAPLSEFCNDGKPFECP